MLIEVLDVDVRVIISNKFHRLRRMLDSLLGASKLFDHKVTVMNLIVGPRQEDRASAGPGGEKRMLSAQDRPRQAYPLLQGLI